MKPSTPISFLAVLSVLLCSAAGAETPDPAACTVEPWDTYGRAFVTPGSSGEGGIGEVTVTVRFQSGPIPDADVVIDLSVCGPDDICVNPDDPGLTGVTNQDGIVRLNPQTGGCDDCAVTVRADGITIRAYDKLVSTDWDGSAPDGAVTGADFTFFATAFKQTGNACSDYNGDGLITGTDFAFFATSFKRGDRNSGGCQ